MSNQKRIKTKYPGVYTLLPNAQLSNKQEHTFYIRYRIGNKQIEEKIGRKILDNMSAAKASQIRLQRMNGQSLPNSEQRKKEQTREIRWTVEALWEEYKSRRSSSDNFRRDDVRMSKHVIPIFGNYLPSEIPPEEIDSFRTEKLKTYAPATVRNMLALLRITLNFAAQNHLGQPFNYKIHMPKVDNITTEDLTQEQFKKLIEAIDNDPDQEVADMMRLVLYSGMRRGELLNLKWNDIDFEKGFIFISNPKGGKSISIPLNERARTILLDHTKTDSEYVFPGRYGGKRVEMKKTLTRIKEAAELPKEFRPLHGLRHVFASTLASSGQVDLYTIQRLLTHKSPHMTQRYAHLRDDALKGASELLDQIYPSKEMEK